MASIHKGTAGSAWVPHRTVFGWTGNDRLRELQTWSFVYRNNCLLLSANADSASQRSSL